MVVAYDPIAAASANSIVADMAVLAVDAVLNFFVVHVRLNFVVKKCKILEAEKSVPPSHPWRVSYTLHVMEGDESENLETCHEPNNRGSFRRRKLEIFFATFPKTWKLACNQYCQGFWDFCRFLKMKFSDSFRKLGGNLGRSKVEG